MQKPERSAIHIVLALGLSLLTACASTASPPVVEKAAIQTESPYSPTATPGALAAEIAAAPIPEADCETEPDLSLEAVQRKLALGNDWHKEKRYQVALEAYESVLVDHASLITDAYALWGIIALRLDRDNPDYDRETARTVAYVLEQRASDALKSDAAATAQLLWFSAKVMLDADVSKDNVVNENRQLRGELAKREEAIQKLRELTVGR